MSSYYCYITLEEYKICIACLKQNPKIKAHLGNMVGNVEEGFSRFELDYCLINFIIRYIKEAGCRRFNNKIIEKLYKEFIDYFSLEKLEYETETPLYNFTCGKQKINFSNSLKIIRLSLKEINERERNSPEHLLSKNQFSPNEYYITCSFKVKKKIESPETIHSLKAPNLIIGQKVSSKIDELVLILRCFKKGSIYAGKSWTKAIEWLPFERKSSSGFDPRISRGIKYELLTKDVKKLKKLYDQITNLEEHDALRTALRRLSFGVERDSYDDKLIDYMIGMEALFLTDSEPGELRFKLALRTAHFLEKKNPHKRKKIFKEMNQAYDARSKIVHGAKVKETIPLKESAEKMEEYLRCSLKEFLKLHPNDRPPKKTDFWGNLVLGDERGVVRAKS